MAGERSNCHEPIGIDLRVVTRGIDPRDGVADEDTSNAGSQGEAANGRRWWYHTHVAKLATFRTRSGIAYRTCMAGRTGPALRLWCVTELRRRWVSLVLLGLLAGIASGLAIAAFDGAERSGTAYTRMRSDLNAADAVFYPSQVQAYDVDVTKLGSLDEVEA